MTAHLHGILLGGVTALMLGTAWFIYVNRAAVAGVSKTIWTEYRSILFCFVGLSMVAIGLGVIADRSAPAGTEFWPTATANVFASLVENLLFFSLLGFGLLIVQRREADRNRSLDDKIDMLFNAKTLRSGEVAFLRDEVRKISADCRTLSVDIDVIAYDGANQLIQIDVSRRWLVANYIASAPAEYTWQLRLAADDACGHHPAMFVFPSYSTAMAKDAAGEWNRSADDELLHPGGEVASKGTLSSEAKKLEIEPAKAREFRSRFQAWQPLFKPSTSASTTVGPVQPEPDTYRLKTERHWDELEISVRNSLKRPIRTTISGAGTQALTVDPGDRKVRAYRGENLSANSHVYVSFAVV